MLFNWQSNEFHLYSNDAIGERHSFYFVFFFLHSRMAYWYIWILYCLNIVFCQVNNVEMLTFFSIRTSSFYRWLQLLIKQFRKRSNVCRKCTSQFTSVKFNSDGLSCLSVYIRVHFCWNFTFWKRKHIEMKITEKMRIDINDMKLNITYFHNNACCWWWCLFFFSSSVAKIHGSAEPLFLEKFPMLNSLQALNWWWINLLQL